MAAIRNQLKSDPVMERLAAHSTFELRGTVTFAWLVAAIMAILIAIFSRGLLAWVAGFGCVCLISVSVYRFRKEQLLLRGYEIVVATVSERVESDGLEGGHLYSVRYRFLADDGKVYLGKSGATDRKLPSEGDTIPVLYKRGDPSQNEALATFWFFRFTYTGAE